MKFPWWVWVGLLLEWHGDSWKELFSFPKCCSLWDILTPHTIDQFWLQNFTEAIYVTNVHSEHWNRGWDPENGCLFSRRKVNSVLWSWPTRKRRKGEDTLHKEQLWRFLPRNHALLSFSLLFFFVCICFCFITESAWGAQTKLRKKSNRQ